MKKILLIFITYLTAGCSTFDPTNIAPAYQNAFKAMKNSIFGYETNFISPELIREIPYASSIVKIGNGPKGLMILESKEKEITTWVSADNVYLQLRKGKIIKTNGLSNNITWVHSELCGGAHVLCDLGGCARVPSGLYSIGYSDLSDGGRVSRDHSYLCSF